MSKPPPWLRAIGWTIGLTVQAALWGLGLAGLLMGIVLWRNWHALADRGVEATGQIVRCEWQTMGGLKHRSGSAGYYSCTYAYRTVPDGPVHDGYFQSTGHFEDGQLIPIRYLPDRPEASAVAKDVEHPSIAPGAMIALGGGFMGWLAWRAWKQPADAKPRT